MFLGIAIAGGHSYHHLGYQLRRGPVTSYGLYSCSPKTNGPSENGTKNSLLTSAGILQQRESMPWRQDAKSSLSSILEVSQMLQEQEAHPALPASLQVPPLQKVVEVSLFCKAYHLSPFCPSLCL